MLAAGLASPRMRAGARTPEELETLFEDAFVVRDRVALAELFEEGAVLVAPDTEEARGTEQIGRLATAMWESERGYLADPRRVLQSRNTALIVGAQSVNVVRRCSDGTWRFAISLLALDDQPTEEER